MRTVVFVFCLALCSCLKETETYIEPEFYPYYNEFINDGKIRGVDLSGMSIIIVFDSSMVGHIWGLGSCRDNKVRINPVFWGNRKDELARKNLIYHELGHALLCRSHEEKNEDGTLNSIMNQGTNTIHLEGDEYIDELFNSTVDEREK